MMKCRNSLHVAIVIDSLKPGGTGRVASIMANYWAKKLSQVTLITLKKEPPFYTLAENVYYQELGVADRSVHLVSGVIKTLGRIRTLVRCLKKLQPDVVIGFFSDINIISILAGRVAGVPVIINERTHPGRRVTQRRWRIASLVFYRFADRLVLQTEGARRFYRHYGVKTTVIPNPVPEPGISDIPVRERIILGAGRLVPLKGFDRLIRAFAKSDVYPEWKLVILGEGRQRMALEALTRDLGVEDYVFLPGLMKDMGAYYQRGSIFVLSSHYEGFPNALAEAMSAGLSCISYDCEFGPSEMIRHNQNGMLINNGDVDGLSHLIYYLVNDPVKRKLLGRKARTDINKWFSTDRVMAQWETLINNMI
ncbi:MAG: glycosyltransferase family 4 protein [Bacteroidales bacterium]|nr:glycosyltransferase family 4 protein [Bacteroidales bacterium]